MFAIAEEEDADDGRLMTEARSDVATKEELEDPEDKPATELAEACELGAESAFTKTEERLGVEGFG